MASIAGFSRSQHGLETFVLADLVGYAALTEAHGNERAAAVAMLFASTARDVVADEEGELVKTLGDAVLLRLAVPAVAARAASSLVRSFAREEGTPLVRVGVHTGSAVRRGGDWFGSAASIAARLADLALPGEVIVSDATRVGMGQSAASLALQSRGAVALKNVAARLEIHAFVPSGGGSAEPGAVVDPVCRMAVPNVEVAASTVFESRRHWFRSDACVDAFERHPDWYAAGTA